MPAAQCRLHSRQLHNINRGNFGSKGTSAAKAAYILRLHQAGRVPCNRNKQCARLAAKQSEQWSALDSDDYDDGDATVTAAKGNSLLVTQCQCVQVALGWVALLLLRHVFLMQCKQHGDGPSVRYMSVISHYFCLHSQNMCTPSQLMQASTSGQQTAAVILIHILHMSRKTHQLASLVAGSLGSLWLAGWQFCLL